MKNKLQLLALAGCTETQIANYKRHQDLRKDGKTPCPALRRNYNTCNGRLEVYLRQLAKEEATCPRRRQEKKEATAWALENARALADFTAHLPEGYITLDQVFQEEVAAAYIEGVNGVLPALDTIDNARRNKVLEIQDLVKEFYADVAIPVTFDGPAYMVALRNTLGEIWKKSPHADAWALGYAALQPLAVETKWVREHQIRKEIRREIESAMLAHFPSMK